MDLCDARRHLSVQFTDEEISRAGAHDQPGAVIVGRKIDQAAARAIRPDARGDLGFVHAILQRDDSRFGLEMRQDRVERCVRILGLHRKEDEIDDKPGILMRSKAALQERLTTVHGHAGEPCLRCGAILARVSYVSYEIVYCPDCQTNGRRYADRRMSRLIR